MGRGSTGEVLGFYSIHPIFMSEWIGLATRGSQNLPAN